MKSKTWTFNIRSDENLHKELISLSTIYNCTLQEMIQHLIKIGLIQIQEKELLEKINNVKNILEKNI